MKNIILLILIVLVLLLGGIVIWDRYNNEPQPNKSNNISNNDLVYSNKNNEVDRIQAGEYYLEYGKYENQTYSIEQGGANYILNKDGTFSCTNFQGTATGTYTVSLETYTNSADTLTDWLICFKSTEKNVGANYNYIINSNNEFCGIQDGGTLKYVGK